MDDSTHLKLESEIKKSLQSNNTAAAAAKILEYVDDLNNIPLNIAITGESGSGKSTFVNAFRGINDEGAAPTGCVETTMEKAPYLHPKYPNVTFWDLPGIGTTKFPAQKYLQKFGFEMFDVFIIISADRFRENDVKLAQEIQKMVKKFYFVRSKIDHNMKDEERKKKFNKNKTLDLIRKNCTEGKAVDYIAVTVIKSQEAVCLFTTYVAQLKCERCDLTGLKEQGIKSPQVFLVSSVEIHNYDFCELWKTLERELPAHKRNALLFAVTNINLDFINKKKEAFQAQIKYHVVLSALRAALPIFVLSYCVDLNLLVNVFTQYTVGFGLDIPSLKKLAKSTGVKQSDLTSVIKSPVAARKLTVEIMKDVLLKHANITALTSAEKGLRLIPLFGISFSMTDSSVQTYVVLKYFLDTLAEDAQNVFKKALGMETPV